MARYYRARFADAENPYTSSGIAKEILRVLQVLSCAHVCRIRTGVELEQVLYQNRCCIRTGVESENVLNQGPMAQLDKDKISAENIRLSGLVQGMGIRPEIWRLAKKHNIVGQVVNDSSGVLIRAWGRQTTLDDFKKQIESAHSSLCEIDKLSVSPLLEGGAPPESFTIVKGGGGEVRTAVCADMASCEECLREISNPTNRRYRYPFTHCTQCGPRFSIIHRLPYDRENTSMAKFSMCEACLGEYSNANDRRFHSQTNACPHCGPTLSLVDSAGQQILPPGNMDEIQLAAECIRNGKIVAIKGIGGFQLACDANNKQAVDLLRQHKQREKKAFALMAANMPMVKKFARVNEDEEKLLRSSAAPIVLLEVLNDNRISEQLLGSVAPGLNCLGFILPYSPLHDLLMKELDFPIVLSSGNLKGDPQYIENTCAIRHLGNVADVFLLNDRDICHRVDDSLLRLQNSRSSIIRRGRGHSPSRIALSLPKGMQAKNILAMGAELKNTFCFLKNGEALLSQYNGDLKNAGVLEAYRQNISLYENLFAIRAHRIAVDMHPNYLSTQMGKQIAADNNLDLVEVQHHHAHIASCMAEHKYPATEGKVLGLVLDGLGYGDDNSFWGGEFLLVDYQSMARVGHFQSLPMPGATMAALEPWRNTVAHLNALDWSQLHDRYSNLDLFRFLSTKPLKLFQSMIEKNLNSPLSSSAGRLFDAVAVALGLGREKISYEGQAAMELECLSRESFRAQQYHAYHYHIANNIIYWEKMWLQILNDLQQKIPRGNMGARFHWTVINAVSQLALNLCEQKKISTVVLSGGVFQNALIQNSCVAKLEAAGLTVLLPSFLPLNDGGISLGQAIIAAHK